MLKPLTVWITTNWKILKEMGIPDHLTCLLRNLYTGGKKQQLELDMEKWTGSNWERSTSILASCLFNLYAEWFSRPEYWSGLPFPSPGDLPNSGIEPSLPHGGVFFTSWATREAHIEECIMWNAELDESQAGIKIAGGNISNLRYAYDITLMQKVKRN